MATTGNRKTSGSKSVTRRKTKKQQMEEYERAHEFRVEVVLWLIVAVSLLLFISNFGFGGIVGKSVSSFLFGLFGFFAYLLPILMLIGSFFAVSNKGNTLAAVKLAAIIFFYLFLCVFMGLVADSSEALKPLDAYQYSAASKLGGGLIGGSIAYVMITAFGRLGSYILTVILLIICLVLITERSALKGMQRGSRKVYESARENNERYREYREIKNEEKRRRRIDNKVSGVSIDTKIAAEAEGTDGMSELVPTTEFTEPEITEEIPVRAHSSKQKAVAEPVLPEPEIAEEHKVVLEPVITGLVEEPKPVMSEPVVTPVTPAPEPAREVITPAPKPASPEPFVTPAEADAVPPKRKPTRPESELQQEIADVADEIRSQEEEMNTREYQFPPIDLLKPAPHKKTGNTEAQLKETAQKLQTVLATFGVNVTITNISCGPAVTRFELQPEMGVKVSKIVGLADDIKLNLAAADIRIEAPIPGKAAVGIEVPNKENVMVAFRELIESQEFQNSKSKISFAVGKDIAGQVKVTDIAKMPHLLIAGATGSGKSVCINTIIMSILYKAKPDEVKLIMIDPKVVELSVYNGIPHLMIPVVTDPKKASGALNWAVGEMTDRYNKFAEANVREINGYNAKVDSIEVPEGVEKPQKMPQIVIIVDELADLMMVASNDVEEAICRLAQLARAAGIHLIIATQRPSVNVITGLIKANMPSRIAFAVTSGTDSRTILDMNGAEKLLGKGDMLFNPQGVPKPIRVQGAFVSDQEVSDIVAFITSENGQAVYSEKVQQRMETIESTNTTVAISDSDNDDDGRDAYFAEAARIIVDKEKASIGSLQRYLKVGFNRAARIMDQLEEAGIVGPEEGTKPRKVLMTTEEFEQYAAENL